MKHTCFGGNVIIKIDTGDITSAGGIVIGTAESREAAAREEAIIESVGEDAFDDLIKDKPKIGDKVVISKYSGKTLGKYPDGFERRVIADTGILARIDEV